MYPPDPASHLLPSALGERLQSPALVYEGEEDRLWAARERRPDRAVRIHEGWGSRAASVRINARTLAQASIACLPALLTEDGDADHAWMVMAEVPGQPLSVFVRQSGPLPIEQAAALLAPVVRAAEWLCGRLLDLPEFHQGQLRVCRGAEGALRLTLDPWEPPAGRGHDGPLDARPSGQTPTGGSPHLRPAPSLSVTEVLRALATLSGWAPGQTTALADLLAADPQRTDPNHPHRTDGQPGLPDLLEQVARRAAPPLAARREGAQVARRYDLLNRLGSGGMGTVYRAVDTTSGKVVSLKVARALLTRAASVQAAIQREIDVLTQLEHPHLVKVQDGGIDPEHGGFVVTALYEDGLDIVSATRDADVATVAAYATQLLEAVQYLALRRVVHRDIKPANIVVSGGVVRLIDFGIAVATDDDHELRGPVGSAGYVAPEVLAGEPASPASDLWSLGVTLWECFTRVAPYRGAAPEVGQLPLGRERLLPDLADALLPLLARGAEDRGPAVPALREQLQLLTGRGRRPTGYLEDRRPPLVGRDGEIRALDGALHRLREGTGGVLCLTGPEGSGRTRMLAEARARAMSLGLHVARVGGGIPFAVLGAWLVHHAGLDPEIGALLVDPVAEDPTGQASPLRDRVRESLVTAIRRARRPLVLLVDDAHRLPDDATDLLRTVLSTVDGCPLLAIVAQDAGAVPAGAHELPLGPLPHPLARELLGSLVQPANNRPNREWAPPGDVLPGLVVAWAAELRASAATDLSHDSFRSLVRIAERRARGLSPDALTLLELAAQAGETFEDAPLSAILGESVAMGSLDEATAARLIRPTGKAWCFEHAAFRDWALENLRTTPDRLRRLADAHARLPHFPALRVATLYARAGESADATRWYLRAAEHALRRGELATARDALVRAWDSPDLDAGRTSVGFRLSEVCYSLGDPPAAEYYARAVLALVDRPLPTSGLGWAAHLAADVLRMFLPATPADATAPLAYQAYVTYALCAYPTSRGPEVLGAALRALHTARRMRAQGSLVRQWAGLALGAGDVGAHRLARTFSRRAFAASAQARADAECARGWVAEGFYLVTVGELETAEGLGLDAERVLAREGTGREVAEAVLLQAWARTERGGDTAGPLYDRLQDDAVARGDTEMEDLARNGQMHDRLTRGDAAGALDLADRAPRPPQVDAGTRWAIRARALVTLGRAREGWQAARDADELLSWSTRARGGHVAGVRYLVDTLLVLLEQTPPALAPERSAILARLLPRLRQYRRHGRVAPAERERIGMAVRRARALGAP